MQLCLHARTCSYINYWKILVSIKNNDPVQNISCENCKINIDFVKGTPHHPMTELTIHAKNLTSCIIFAVLFYLVGSVWKMYK